MSYYELHLLEGEKARGKNGTNPYQLLGETGAGANHNTFNIAIGGFIASHIPLKKMTSFLKGVHAVLEPGAAVILFDNRYVEGNSTPISRVDEEGNSYQMRELEGKGKFEVMKNFPTEDDWRKWVSDGCSMDYWELEYFWVVRIGQ